MRTYNALSRTLLIASVVISAPLALIACNVFNQGSHTTPTQAYQASTIEVVYSRVPAMIGESPLSPLFGDWPEHSAVVARLALALDTATPITPTKQLLVNEHGRYLRIHMRDGTELAVRQLAWCEQWSPRIVLQGWIHPPERYLVGGWQRHGGVLRYGSLVGGYARVYGPHWQLTGSQKDQGWRAVYSQIVLLGRFCSGRTG